MKLQMRFAGSTFGMRADFSRCTRLSSPASAVRPLQSKVSDSAKSQPVEPRLDGQLLGTLVPSLNAASTASSNTSSAAMDRSQAALGFANTSPFRQTDAAAATGIDIARNILRETSGMCRAASVCSKEPGARFLPYRGDCGEKSRRISLWRLNWWHQFVKSDLDSADRFACAHAPPFVRSAAAD